MNVFKVLVFLSLLVVTTGCTPVNNVTGGADAKNATEVTLAQLKEATKDETSFFYCGCDNKYNYFMKGKDGAQNESDVRYFRVSSSVKLPGIQRHIDDFIKRQIEPGKLAVNVYFADDTIKPFRLVRP